MSETEKLQKYLRDIYNLHLPLKAVYDMLNEIKEDKYEKQSN